MATQQPPPRPWFRLPSVSRPSAATAPTPAPEPTVPQPRPVIARPFRTIAPPQPTQPPTAPASPITAPPQPSAPVEPVPMGLASVPTSPRPPRVIASSTSLPPSTMLPIAATTTTASSVPSSPKPIAPAPTSSVPSSPAPAPVSTTSSVPPSPAPKPVSTTTLVPSPAPSPRTIKPEVQTPTASPKPKPTAPPPSPFNLPPSQIKSNAEPEAKIPLVAQQKTVLVHEKTIDKPKARLNGSDSERDLSDFFGTRASKDGEAKLKGHRKKISSDSEDVGTRVITIAGENKGAFMEVVQSPKKHTFEGNSHHLHEKGHSRIEGRSLSSYSSGGEEGKINIKDKSQKGKAMGSNPVSAFMNSNVQGVNNSIVYNSSCAHHDPGVHLALSRKAAGGGVQVKERGNGYKS